MDKTDFTEMKSLLQSASRDFEAALVSTECLYMALVPRFETIGGRAGGLEHRISGLEQRVSGLERGMDQIGRSNHRIETLLAAIAAKLP